MPIEPKNDVSAKSEAVGRMSQEWDLAVDLLGGTDAMRKAGEKRLPRWPSEERKGWETRLAASTLFPAFERTVVALASKPFSKPPTLELSGRMEELAANIDRQGRSVAEFGHDVMTLAMGPGYGGILVDFERNPAPGQTTVADERRLGLRPYWVLIHPHQVLGWRAKPRGDGYELTQLRLMESVEEEDGDFGTKSVEQVRVLEPGKWAVYRKSPTARPDEKTWALHEEGTTTIDFVPFIPFYGRRIAFMMGGMPLRELGHLNVKHWQSQSDQDNLLHVARVPVLTLSGVVDDPDKPFELALGAQTALRLPQGAELRYVEHTGAAIGAGKTALDDLKEEMRQAGAELLVVGPGPSTRIEAGADDSKGTCVLQRIAASVEDALCQALDYTAKWLNETPDAKKRGIKLFDDYGVNNLAEASASLLVGMANSGALSKKTLFSELKRRAILSSDVDYEAEIEQIQSEGPPEPPTEPGAGGPGPKPPQQGAK